MGLTLLLTGAEHLLFIGQERRGPTRAEPKNNEKRPKKMIQTIQFHLGSSPLKDPPSADIDLCPSIACLEYDKILLEGTRKREKERRKEGEETTGTASRELRLCTVIFRFSFFRSPLPS